MRPSAQVSATRSALLNAPVRNRTPNREPRRADRGQRYSGERRAESEDYFGLPVIGTNRTGKVLITVSPDGRAAQHLQHLLADADGNRNQAVDLQLLDERRRHLVGRGGDDDAIEGAPLPASRA